MHSNLGSTAHGRGILHLNDRKRLLMKLIERASPSITISQLHINSLRERSLSAAFWVLCRVNPNKRCFIDNDGQHSLNHAAQLCFDVFEATYPSQNVQKAVMDDDSSFNSDASTNSTNSFAITSGPTASLQTAPKQQTTCEDISYVGTKHRPSLIEKTPNDPATKLMTSQKRCAEIQTTDPKLTSKKIKHDQMISILHS